MIGEELGLATRERREAVRARLPIARSNTNRRCRFYTAALGLVALVKRMDGGDCSNSSYVDELCGLLYTIAISRLSAANTACTVRSSGAAQVEEKE